MRILTILPPPWESLGPLIARSRGEGLGFLERLRDEYHSGVVRFDGVGEILFGAFDGAQLVGIGGLTRDPYVDDPDVGRVRHLYVAPEHRRQGCGRALMDALEEAAHGHFTRLRLRTDTVDGARFYERVGFSRTNESSATHCRELQRSLEARSSSP